MHGDGGAVSDDSGVGSLNDDDDDNMPQDDDVDGFTCAPYYRTLGEGDLAVHVCPILNVFGRPSSTSGNGDATMSA